MSNDAFKERERALEEAFFHKVDVQLLENLRTELADQSEREKLASATGIQDENLLQELVSEGISAESVTAVALVPLVLVAWASGDVDAKEKSAILQAAHEQGVDESKGAAKVLEAWLQYEPDDGLLAAWTHYVQATMKTMSEGSQAAFRTAVIGRARKVAKASGGLMGIAAISINEQKVLDQLEAAMA